MTGSTWHLESGGSSRIRLLLTAVGLGLGPALFTLGEVVHHQFSDFPVLAALLSCAGLYIWIAGILGQGKLLRPGADVLGLVGLGVAFLGLIAVSNIMVFQLIEVLIVEKAKNYPEVVAGVFRRVLFVTYIFGPVFPLGLFILGIGLHRLRIFPIPVTVIYLLGVASFPAGRLAGIPPLIHLTDGLMTMGSVGMAWYLLKHPGLWPESRD